MEGRRTETLHRLDHNGRTKHSTTWTKWRKRISPVGPAAPGGVLACHDLIRRKSARPVPERKAILPEPGHGRTTVRLRAPADRVARPFGPHDGSRGSPGNGGGTRAVRRLRPRARGCPHLRAPTGAPAAPEAQHSCGAALEAAATTLLHRALRDGAVRPGVTFRDLITLAVEGLSPSR
ncbi:SbtR family transcriptional regulator [Streptomyces arboris]|uniref:SbtR family transcriptional regulator n=1 Tax=Streptomyces arboris TaxID=2600619 RepID=UPI003850F607